MVLAPIRPHPVFVALVIAGRLMGTVESVIGTFQFKVNAIPADLGKTPVMGKSVATRKNATILDVAGPAGVSKSTVSLVLNGQPLIVKEVQAWANPLIAMVRARGKGSYDYAGSDNALGTFMATNHLLEKGHRRIGLLGGRSGAFIDDRLQGYRAAMKKHFLKEHPELL